MQPTRRTAKIDAQRIMESSGARGGARVARASLRPVAQETPPCAAHRATERFGVTRTAAGPATRPVRTRGADALLFGRVTSIRASLIHAPDQCAACGQELDGAASILHDAVRADELRVAAPAPSRPGHSPDARAWTGPSRKGAPSVLTSGSVTAAANARWPCRRQPEPRQRCRFSKP